MHTECRWATPAAGGLGVEIMREAFHRTATGEYCVGCGKQDTLWEGSPDSRGRSHARLCTHCGTLTRFAEQPEPAFAF